MTNSPCIEPNWRMKQMRTRTSGTIEYRNTTLDIVTTRGERSYRTQTCKTNVERQESCIVKIENTVLVIKHFKFPSVIHPCWCDVIPLSDICSRIGHTYNVQETDCIRCCSSMFATCSLNYLFMSCCHPLKSITDGQRSISPPESCEHPPNIRTILETE